MRVLILMACLTGAACGGPATPLPPPVPTPPPISSTDFALLPCTPSAAPNPCVLVMAGGKRVLFGAPAYARDRLTEEDLRNLDAVMLFSLRGEDIEGLDEVRNASWRAGHDTPLRVSGPSGTGDVLSAINRAYEAADAFTYVEHSPAGGFNAAVLQALPGEQDTKTHVFNTGDLVITHLVNDRGWVGYWVDYNGVRLVLEPCGMTQASHFGGEVGLVVGCDGEGLAWPVSEVVFIAQPVAEEGAGAP